VASGAWETFEPTAPNGKIWFLKNLRMEIPADGDATSGSHRVYLISLPNKIELLGGESTYDTDLVFKYGYWNSANSFAYPPDSATPQKVVTSVLIDDENGIRISYNNETDVAQENDRIYYLDVLEVKHS